MNWGNIAGSLAGGGLGLAFGGGGLGALAGSALGGGLGSLAGGGGFSQGALQGGKLGLPFLMSGQQGQQTTQPQFTMPQTSQATTQQQQQQPPIQYGGGSVGYQSALAQALAQALAKYQGGA